MIAVRPATSRIPTHASLPLLVGAIVAGLALGLGAPALAVRAQILGDGFIRLLAWLMCPLIFCMLVDGAAALGRHRGLGRIGVAMLGYFGVMSLLSMVVGLVAGWLLEPGIGTVADGMRTFATRPMGTQAAPGWLDRLPPLQANNLVLLALALPVGLAVNLWPGRAARLLDVVDRARAALLTAVRLWLRLAPLAAFGAMAAAVGRSGLGSLLPLLRFVVAINLVSVVFVVVVYGGVARLARLSLLRLIVYLREELLLVAVTGATLAALTPLSDKLDRLGCPRRLSDIVLPFSYSLNLAGTYLYIAIALVFLAEAAHVPLDWHELALMLGVGLLSSKGAACVAGSALATVAATAAMLHIVPPDTVAMLIAIDRTMKCRLLTNVIGHGLACLVVARLDGSLDGEALRRGLGAD